MEVNDAIREFWEAEGETDPRTAAKYLLAMIPWDERETALLTLLAHQYSDFLSREGTQKQPRRTSSQNPAARRTAVERNLDLRPFYVPSLKDGVHPGWVHFKDMTEAYWQEWIDYRYRKIESLKASITWAEKIIQSMRQNEVTVSGDLPGEVKENIFTGVPE